MQEYLSIGEAAKILGTSHSTAKRRIRASGLGVHMMDDRLVAVRRSDLDRVARIAAGVEPAVVRRNPSHLICIDDAAARLKGSRQAVRRAAMARGLGIRVGGNRLVAVRYGDLTAISQEMHRRSGNPEWIARRGIGPHSRVRRRRGA